MPRPLRAPIRWFGGKGRLVSRLLPLVPSGGRPYCEPFSGAASLLFARNPAPVEVLNDLDGRVVNLFRVLQDPGLFPELQHRLKYTLYSRSEFARAIEILQDESASPVMQAWATFVGFNQGFAAACNTVGDWGRVFTSNSGMASSTCAWISRLNLLDVWHKRLQRVQVDSRDALEAIRYWDTEETVFYCDPPYVLSTRVKGKRNRYAVEQNDEFHAQLVELLRTCRGAVVLSGYSHPIYTLLEESGWHRTEIRTSCHAAGRIRGSQLRGNGAARREVPRIECVWRNPKAVKLAIKSPSRPGPFGRKIVARP